ncbi:MAG: aldehyde reductase [Alphaproteobacteria bacterium]
MADGDLVFVTGASGFLAKHCVAAALQAGYRVRGSLRGLGRADEVRAAVATVVDPGDRLDFVALDLTSDDGWDEALAGGRYLMHVASPFPLQPPKRRDELVGPAREGTLRALKAAARNGVARTVLTSSTAAIYQGHPRGQPRIFTEADWTVVDSPTTPGYPLSKTLAERAAWDFMAADASGMELAVINPSLILGPALDRHIGSSAEVIALAMGGKYPAVPRIDIALVDVRDVAAMHVAALGHPQAAGERFICSTDSLWLMEVCRVLHTHFPEFRKRLPKRELPDFLVRMVALFDRNLRATTPDLGVKRPVSNDKARTRLGFEFRPAEEAIVAMGRSLIDLGIVKPT